ncbi:Protein TIC 62, chloroplastic [Cucurbita argyrosperma subsp. argyrosperma]|nr:Protein TIC 62, chloroplastic [Cucurbita argyrosperma subsp. argyrosperma]
MEGTCSSLRSPALTIAPSSLSRSGFSEKPLLPARAVKLSKNKRYPLARSLKFLPITAQASSTSSFSSEAAPAISKKEGSKDEDLSVKKIKLDEAVEKLETVVCDLERPNQIGPAIGNASIVICCIGASEKEIFDISGPYRIDYMATKNLVEAATVAKVKHFVLLTSLGTNKIGFPAAILNLFWGVLLWKRKAEEALIASGLPYTIVRPGGMERPTDTFKETHNTTVSPEDTLFGGLVAELMACIAKNPGLSCYKVIEVIAETTAPLTPLEDLLTKIPSKKLSIDVIIVNLLVSSYIVEVMPTFSFCCEPSSIAKEKESAEAKAPTQRVSSEQLNIAKEKESAVANVTKQSSSPYISYEDLKPPTSPTPSAPVGIVDGVSSIAQTSSSESSTEIAEAKPAPAPEKAVTPLSPYVAYEDLKPPTSPSPSAPSLSFSSTSPSNGPPQPATANVNSSTPIPEADVSSETHLPKPKKLQPLSPFTMDERFSKEEHYEWFKDYSHFRNLILPLLKPDSSVLELGSGNSKLSEELYNDGITDITCIDLSAVAVEKMQKRLHLKGMKEIKVLEADMLDMPFGDECFDVVVEKGTMDVLFVDGGDPWNPQPSTRSKVMAMLEGVHRVLKKDGIFVSITFGQPHFRRPLFNAPEFTWSFECSTFGDGFHYFFYTLRKGRRSSDDMDEVERSVTPSICLLQDELEGEDYMFRTDVDELNC